MEDDYKRFISLNIITYNPSKSTEVGYNRSKGGFILNDKPFTGIFWDDDLYMIENGKLHNLTGPAHIECNGNLRYAIYGEFVGENLSNEEFKQKIKEFVFK